MGRTGRCALLLLGEPPDWRTLTRNDVPTSSVPPLLSGMWVVRGGCTTVERVAAWPNTRYALIPSRRSQRCGSPCRGGTVRVWRIRRQGARGRTRGLRTTRHGVATATTAG